MLILLFAQFSSLAIWYCPLAAFIRVYMLHLYDAHSKYIQVKASKRIFILSYLILMTNIFHMLQEHGEGMRRGSQGSVDSGIMTRDTVMLLPMDAHEQDAEEDEECSRVEAGIENGEEGVV